MKKAYISAKSNIILREYLEAAGYSLAFTDTKNLVYDAISCHPDIFMCKMGVREDAPVVFACEGEIGFSYPDDVAFNAVCTGRYFIHNFSATCPRLLEHAKQQGMEMINVRQGYTRCSAVPVDENSIITYDRGIASSCARYAPDLKVLLVQPGHCLLEGFSTGFIGGCCGRVGDTIVFNGNLEAHPDFVSILSFIESRGLKCLWFPEYELTDIGSIITGFTAESI